MDIVISDVNKLYNIGIVLSLVEHLLTNKTTVYEMKWNEKPIVPWRAKASSFEGQLNIYTCDELFRMVV